MRCGMELDVDRTLANLGRLLWQKQLQAVVRGLCPDAMVELMAGVPCLREVVLKEPARARQPPTSH
uniref:Uncharacterized protein n=1 Tax=Arundo donax TaxID=35708 RepID=A0A0A9GFJ6_ARUDO